MAGGFRRQAAAMQGGCVRVHGIWHSGSCQACQPRLEMPAVCPRATPVHEHAAPPAGHSSRDTAKRMWTGCLRQALLITNSMGLAFCRFWERLLVTGLPLGQPQIQAVCASFSCSISLAKTWAQSPLEAPLGLQCPLGNSRHATTDVWGQVTVVCLTEASGR